MKDLQKYNGIFPALYACYDDNGAVCPTRTRAFTKYLIEKGVHGLYVGGSSGECIYQSVEERKIVLENVMLEAKGKIVIIAHVACNNTADSCALAAHAQAQGVDAIAAIPPIYFKLPPHAIIEYWNSISNAAPETDFIIYNIPQLAGVALTIDILKQMKKNPRLIGVKNSSPAVQDIQMFKDEGGENFVVFNGPDEQFISGLLAGACGGIGGTYGVCPELFLKAFNLYNAGDLKTAAKLQNEICRNIYAMCGAKGSMYSVIKGILRKQGIEIGDVRSPFPKMTADDQKIVDACHDKIQLLIKEFCN